MGTKIKILGAAFLLLSIQGIAQTVELLTSGTKTSLRGLSVVNDRTIWVSGSNGTIGKSTDGGTSWRWITVPGFEKTDFRDIEAFDDKTAVIMGIAEPAYILRTADGGDTWKVVYENKSKGMFLDAMEFWNLNSGIVVGDPIDRKIFVARTFNGGITWQHIPTDKMPIADSGEAMFASSGTNVRALNNQEAIIVTGGLKSRLLIRDQALSIPIVQGKESTGANSIAIKKGKTLVVVGGDFNDKDNNSSNCFISNDKGQTFTAPATPPHGYRSSVEYLGKSNWVSCGLNGVDISTDDGKNWRWISKEGFHACRRAKAGKAVYFTGGNGKIGRLKLM
ncbi:MAG: hypothetical protein RL172_1111 [Bacteroidota bacterium]